MDGLENCLTPHLRPMLMSKDFPKDFMWGTATSSYQIEGAHDVDGRTLSIWDTFCRQPGKVFEGQTGDVACQHYLRWEEDIKILRELGVNAYRFSIAWPRIFPDKSKTVNKKGIDFYSRLIDKLLENDIEPFITMYHWDLPQYIQDQGDGHHEKLVIFSGTMLILSFQLLQIVCAIGRRLMNLL